MFSQFSRSELVMGKAAVLALRAKRVAVFGVGGVGSFAIEALARAGIGYFLLVDNDVVSITNINRQLVALHSTIGLSKVDVMKERILDINPDANVEIHNEFYLADSTSNIITEDLSYVVDCVDTIMAKIAIICKSKEIDVPVMSCMGTGNKLDPTKFEIDDIYKTSYCPLARIMKKDLKKRNIKKLKVLYSKEHPINTNDCEINQNENKHKVKGSVSFMPPVAGLIIAGEVIKDIVGK